MTLRNLTPERYKLFRSCVRIHPNIIYWIKTICPWDVELEIEVPSTEEFYNIANEIKDKFSDIIDTFEPKFLSL